MPQKNNPQQITDGNDARLDETFVVVRVTRADLTGSNGNEAFSESVMAKLSAVEDEQMCKIAECLAESLMEGYREALRYAAASVLGHDWIAALEAALNAQDLG